LRQTYVLAILAVLFAFGFYINIKYIFSPHESDSIHDHIHEVDAEVYKTHSDLTWESLIHDCGAAVIIENTARAQEIFNRKYHKKAVEWKGYFIDAYINNLNPFDYNPDHLINLGIRMIPSESLKGADLILAINANKYSSYVNFLRGLSTGTPVKFTASFEALGNEWRPHHLHMIKLEKCEDFIEHDKKIILFHGVNFNISGHLKLNEEVKKIQTEVEAIKSNGTAITEE
jgi:hypothetical protein